MKVSYAKKLLEDCPEEISKRQSCANYSTTTGKCKRRWAGRSPDSPCDAWKQRPAHWSKGVE